MMGKTFIDAPGDRVFDVYGFHQAQLVTEASATLLISGQVGSVTSDLPGQLDEALSHIQELLSLAEMDWPNVVKLTILTTDVETLLGSWSRVRRRFEQTGSVPPNTLAEVSRFAHRAIFVEIDAIAMR
jgi:enamine deaminase RidA (YjgF/YER057c/UK114 family)